MYSLSDKDHLDLWKYFQGRADNLKEVMFRTVTWTLSLGSGLLGVLVIILTDFDKDKAAIELPWAVAGTASAGLTICLYAWFILNESAKHIQANWNRADLARAKIEGISSVLESAKSASKSTMKIWDQLRILVALYAAAFVLALSWAALS